MSVSKFDGCKILFYILPHGRCCSISNQAKSLQRSKTAILQEAPENPGASLFSRLSHYPVYLEPSREPANPAITRIPRSGFRLY